MGEERERAKQDPKTLQQRTYASDWYLMTQSLKKLCHLIQ